jgi:hypothetical protein
MADGDPSSNTSFPSRTKPWTTTFLSINQTHEICLQSPQRILVQLVFSGPPTSSENQIKCHNSSDTLTHHLHLQSTQSNNWDSVSLRLSRHTYVTPPIRLPLLLQLVNTQLKDPDNLLYFWLIRL